jgi:hypothetical protein
MIAVRNPILPGPVAAPAPLLIAAAPLLIPAAPQLIARAPILIVLLAPNIKNFYALFMYQRCPYMYQ